MLCTILCVAKFTREVQSKGLCTNTYMCLPPPPPNEYFTKNSHHLQKYLFVSRIQQPPPLKGAFALGLRVATFTSHKLEEMEATACCCSLLLLLLHACASFACCLGTSARACMGVCVCACVCMSFLLEQESMPASLSQLHLLQPHNAMPTTHSCNQGLLGCLSFFTLPPLAWLRPLYCMQTRSAACCCSCRQADLAGGAGRSP